MITNRQAEFNMEPQLLFKFEKINESFSWYFSGTMLIYAGGQQPNQKTNVGSNVLNSSFLITGSIVLNT